MWEEVKALLDQWWELTRVVQEEMEVQAVTLHCTAYQDIANIASNPTSLPPGIAGETGRWGGQTERWEAKVTECRGGNHQSPLQPRA